jgi:DNA-binding MarR family transcriptional regulator
VNRLITRNLLRRQHLPERRRLHLLRRIRKIAAVLTNIKPWKSAHFQGYLSGREVELKGISMFYF